MARRVNASFMYKAHIYVTFTLLSFTVEVLNHLKQKISIRFIREKRHIKAERFVYRGKLLPLLSVLEGTCENIHEFLRWKNKFIAKLLINSIKPNIFHRNARTLLASLFFFP